MNTPATRNREQWLNDAAELIAQEIIAPAQGKPYPPFRVSVAPMSAKKLGCCYKRAASADGKNEIFISAHEADSALILGTLVHELIHAYDDTESGHRNYFAQTARKVGLEGKFTDTHPGDILTAQLAEYVHLLGPIPHAELKQQPKEKGRNNNKVRCTRCEFKANLSRKWADAWVANLSRKWADSWVATPTDNNQCPICNQYALEIIFA